MSTVPVRQGRRKISARSKAPTRAQMERTVRAYLKHAHPDAKDAQLVLMNSLGGSDVELPILTPPPGWESPDPLTDEQRGVIHRHALAEQARKDHARRSFVRWWTEFVAAINDLDLDLQRIVGELGGKLSGIGIDEDRVRKIGSALMNLATEALIPPFPSALDMPDPLAGVPDPA